MWALKLVVICAALDNKLNSVYQSSNSFMFPPPPIPTWTVTLLLHPLRLKKDNQMKTTHRQCPPAKNKHLKPPKMELRKKKKVYFLAENLM